MADETEQQSTNTQADVDKQDATDTTTSSSAEESKTTAASEPQTAQTVAPTQTEHMLNQSPTDTEMSAQATQESKVGPVGMVGAAQKTMSQPAPPPNDHPEIQNAGKFHRVAEVLAGGPRTQWRVNEKGEMESRRVPLTGGQIAMGILASVLGGMGAARGARNPVEAIGAGAQYGMQQAKERNQEAQQAATADYNRKTSTIQANMALRANQNVLAKQDLESNQHDVDAYTPMYKSMMETPELANAIIGTAKAHELVSKLAENQLHIADHSFFPIGVEQVMNEDGTPKVDAMGVPVLEKTFAIVDPKALVKVPEETRKILQNAKIPGFVNTDDKPIKLPDDMKLKVSTLVGLIHKASELKTLENEFKRFGEEGSATENGVATRPKPIDPSVPAKQLFNGDVGKLADSMAQYEAGNKKDARSIRDNNPGNLIATPDWKGLVDNENLPKGAAPFRKYPTAAEGRQAQIDMLNNLLTKHPDLSIMELIGGKPGVYPGYSPDNAPGNAKGQASAYANFVYQQAHKGQPNEVVQSSGLGMKPVPMSEIAKQLDDDDLKTFRTLGGFDAFFDGTPEHPSTADAAVKNKQVSMDAVNHIKSLMESADGKYKGQAFIDKWRSDKIISQKVETEEKLRPGKVETVKQEAVAREEAKKTGETWGDTTKKGDDYIGTLKPDQAAQLKSMYEGRMTPERVSYFVSRQPAMATAMSLAYPDFDITKAQNYSKVSDDFTHGLKSRALNSGATALKHLHDLKQINDANSVQVHQWGSKAYNAYNNLADTVTGELLTFYQMPKTNESVKDMKSTLTALANRNASILRQAKSMGEKFRSDQKTWTNAAPSKAYQRPMPGIDDEAEKNWKTLDPNGYSEFSAEQERQRGKGVVQSGNEQIPKPPEGATGIAPGSDGQDHYHDAQGKDLGVVK
jgi:hypothetical protein